MELADTSVWARKRDPQIRPWFDAAFNAGDIAVCDMVALEMLVGSRRADYRATSQLLREGAPWIQMEAADWHRVFQVHALLAVAGAQLHRSVKISDLLIAAAAERANITLVHYDQHFDTIGEVTGQPMRWVATRGALG